MESRRSRRCRSMALGSTLVALVALPLRAQCPDGSPPPCRSAPAARPAAATLDDHTWVVVPFDNMARSSEVEWLRDASVNLLSLDLSRWTDIKVVDDKRVSDLVRQLPPAAAAQLSLNDGLAVARRAGAGKLVMGEVLRIGSRTTVQARVINVRDGQRLRVVRDETAIQDSLMPMFGRLAEKILEVAPPPGANVGVVGTTRADAYQEYLSGVVNFRVFKLGDARKHLEAALRLDSAFALAHVTMALLIGWEDPNAPARITHARAAERFGASLPQHVRTLIAGLMAFYNGDYGRSCELYDGLVKADSANILALYGLGDCAFHDNAVVPVAGDSAAFRFRSDWNVSLWALRRALAIDPGFHIAFQHILDALTTEVRNGCRLGRQPCDPYAGFLRAGGDSLPLEIQVVPVRDPAYPVRLAEARRSDVRSRNLDLALRAAQAWAAAAPPVGRAHAALGHIYLLQGRVAAAASELDRAGTELSPLEATRVLGDRMEVAVKQWDAVRARQHFDSITVAVPLLLRGQLRAQLGLLFGQYGGFDSLLATGLAGAPPAFRTYRSMFTRVLLGLPPDSMAEREAAAYAVLAQQPGCPVQCRLESVLATLSFGLRLPRRTWPPLDSGLTTPLGPYFKAALAVSRSDSSLARIAVGELDSLAVAYGSRPEAFNASLVATEALLWLGDSVSAYQRTVRVLDTLAVTVPMAAGTGAIAQLAPGFARVMIQRGDLAAALARPEDARLWYRRFLDFWARSDAEFKPLMDRVRKAYAAVGGT